MTLRDVAKACGLSVYPVSRALSGKPGVTEETREMVRATARKLGYDQNQNESARRLALRKTGEKPISHVLGLLMPDLTENGNFFLELFRGITEEILKSGYGVLFLPTYDRRENKALSVQLPLSVERGEIDGLIVHSGLSAAALKHLRTETGFGDSPIICVMSKVLDCPAVFVDERQAARLSMEHLLSLGHRKVLAYTKHKTVSPWDKRLAGFKDACKAVGIAPEECLIPVGIKHDAEVAGPLKEAIKQHPDATALITHNDPVALTSCFELTAMGLRVPEDISVIGRDDTDPLLDGEGRNTLTSVRFDLAEMGRLAARMIIDRDEAPQGDTVLSATVIIRGTTTAPKAVRPYLSR